MVASNLTRYINDKDKHGIKVGEWAEQVSPGYFRCKVCVPAKDLCFKPGRNELFKHSESDKHRKAFTSFATKSQTQPTLDEAFKQDDDVLKKAKDFEIAIVAMISRHDVSVTFADCLIPMLKKHLNDSEILKKVELKNRKASYVARYGLGEYFEKETINKLQNCIAFSVSLDESEVNKHNELEIVVNVASRAGLELRHYKCIDLDGSTSQHIVDSFLDALIEDKIDYKSKCINISTDGCATMIGVNNGVIKKLQDEIPELHHTGSCNGHNLNNTMQKGVNAFDPDMVNAVVDLYELFGGSKGKGLKSMHQFEQSCLDRGHVPKQFNKFISVRFRSIRTCIEPAIYNFHEIVHFLKELKKTKKKLTDREKRLIEYFVEREDLTSLKLKFVFAATGPMTEKIDFFEKNEAHVHNIADAIESIYVDQLRCILDDSELSVLDFETDELRKKSRVELISIDVDNAKLLSKKQMFIGSECSKEIKSLGLSPDSKQLIWLFDSVKKFHFTVIRSLQKYFSTPMKSSIMDCFSALGQSKQSHVLTANKLKTLANKYSKVVDNIDAVDGADTIRREIDRYITDEDIKEFDKLSYEDYWLKVASITDGSENWPRYVVLPFFSLGIGTKFNSNSEVERKFSLMNNIHQDKHKNRMLHDTLNSHLHIKTGVESKVAKRDCKECKALNERHCHCSLLEIDSNLRDSCKKAKSKYKESLNKDFDEKLVESEAMKAKKAKVDEEIQNSTLKKKEKLAKSAKFCNPVLFESVYKTTKDKNDINSNSVKASVPSSSEKSKTSNNKRKGEANNINVYKIPKFN